MCSTKLKLAEFQNEREEVFVNFEPQTGLPLPRYEKRDTNTFK